jgi:tRNA dimethylallyltransferase
VDGVAFGVGVAAVNDSLPPSVAIFGATGTGKTTLAAALADRLRFHLVSCDAVQIYRDLHVATAKPEGAERRHVWSLIDAVPPAANINAGEWVRLAEPELRWAASAGRIPLIVGGTGMYLRALAKGLANAPAREPELRERLERLAERHGVPRLHRLLMRFDPATASGLRATDRQRLVRALEIRLGHGLSLSAIQAGGWRGPDRFRLVRLGLTRERSLLYKTLDQRVERFFSAGLVSETQWLLDHVGLSPEANALRAIGYRDVVAWLTSPQRTPMAALIESVQRNTRHYAKRQSTWFRSEPETFWLDADDPQLLDRAFQQIVSRLGL